MKKIIINADDFGLAKNFNEGILELAQKRIITSTTVMINRPFARSSEPQKAKNISTGLHLELETDSSIKEIENQIKLFRKIFDKEPSHLDGHQHLHLTKENLPKIIKIAQKHNLPIRSRFDEDRRVLKKSGIRTPDQFISWHPSRKEILFEKINSVQEEVVELVCHPGYFDRTCDYPYNRQLFRLFVACPNPGLIQPRCVFSCRPG